MNQIHIPLWEDTTLESDGAGGFSQRLPTTVRSLTLKMGDVCTLIDQQTLRNYAEKYPEKVKVVPVPVVMGDI